MTRGLATNKNKKSRGWLLFVSGVALISFFAVGIYLWFAHPIGHGPAGPRVSRAAFQQPWTTNAVMLVGLGDSITAGFGARKGYGYFDRLHVNPADEFPDMQGIALSAAFLNLRVTNLAVSGSTSFEHIQKQLPQLPRMDSNILGLVVLTTGGNDLIHNYGRTPPRPEAMYGANWEQAQPWIEAFERRLKSILDEIDARFPGGCFIFLANIYDPTDEVGDIHRVGLPEWKDGLKILAAYNNVIHKVSVQRSNVRVVDLYKTFLGHGIHCVQFWRTYYDKSDPHYWYHVNLEDPNERGYDAIRRLYLNEILQVVPNLK
jgi:lysophospholipase L1-like esterase